MRGVGRKDFSVSFYSCSFVDVCLDVRADVYADVNADVNADVYADVRADVRADVNADVYSAARETKRLASSSLRKTFSFILLGHES